MLLEYFTLHHFLIFLYKIQKTQLLSQVEHAEMMGIYDELAVVTPQDELGKNTKR